MIVYLNTSLALGAKLSIRKGIRTSGYQEVDIRISEYQIKNFVTGFS